jgi:cell shape-determining protein MreC
MRQKYRIPIFVVASFLLMGLFLGYEIIFHTTIAQSGQDKEPSPQQTLETVTKDRDNLFQQVKRLLLENRKYKDELDQALLNLEKVEAERDDLRELLNQEKERCKSGKKK